MNRISRLDAVIRQFDLNDHPFYTSWRAGTLPTEKLADYGVEYGRFIGTIADGWESVGRPDYAAEERLHEDMWQKFRAELPAVNTLNYVQTDVLVDSAKALFAKPIEALGALYSFEAQQPHTSQSKLDGLMEHYTMSAEGLEYFVVHAGDVQEAEDLREAILKLSDAEFERALGACKVVCASMWSALDGIYFRD